MDAFTLSSNFGTTAKLAVVLATFIFFYVAGLGFYRLFLSPLAKFPGPKITALTCWYEFYHDYFCHGTFIFRIEEMHRKYGPIVRINPHELSIHDQAFYHTIYVTESQRRTENYHHFVKGIDFDGSHFLTTSHDLHRRRRKPLEPFFSRAGVMRLEPMLHGVLRKLHDRFKALEGKSAIVRFDHVFSAFSGDIIGKICCESKEDFLDHPEFAPHWFDLLHAIIKSIPLFMGFPFLIQIVGRIPESVLLWIDPRSQAFNRFKKLAHSHILDAKQEKSDAHTISKHADTRVSLFRHILDSDMPASELSTDRLSKEAQVLLGAGTASTARTLVFISYYILAKDQIRVRLGEELRDIMANYPKVVPSLVQLEQLPYLKALIREGLRLSYGVMHRLPRCSPDFAIQYKQWSIPKGVPVGMSAYLMHTDSTIFERPFEFVPERWLGETSPLMSKSLVPFSRGSRSCLGMNLAYAELYLVLAVLYRPGGPKFELFQTDESDVIQAHDFLLPLPKLDTNGVRVRVQ